MLEKIALKSRIFVVDSVLLNLRQTEESKESTQNAKR
jgi:hypothetical protein